MADKNLYAAPQADLEEQAQPVPVGILRKIKMGWAATLVNGLMSLATTLVGMSRAQAMSSEAWGLVDVALMFGLAFGIHKKSRTCAVIMLLYFAAGKVAPIIDSGNLTGTLVGLLFLLALLQGMTGTFAYHRFRKESLAVAPYEA